MTNNPILRADSYKYSHYKQYPPETYYVSSYIEARKGDAVFFGLQAFLNSLRPIDSWDVTEAQDFLSSHGVPFNFDGWMHIVEHHNGKLPLYIQALPEGTLVPRGVPMLQIRNTDPKVPWLTSFIETQLLRALWYPSTVATISRQCKAMIYQALLQSADDPDGEIDFKLHDFGARGVSSGESSAIGGAAHLINFKGTDNVEALLWLRDNYNEPMAGFSIPAAEHSTITAWGQENEDDAYRNMLEAFPKAPLVAVVSDSYDIFTACTNIWGGTLHADVVALKAQGRTLVIRPDSGDPLETLTEVAEILFQKFGYVRNSRGFRLLPRYLRIIQGDGINVDSLQYILDGLIRHDISVSNVNFGMGGGLLQKCDRDTLGFAMKASSVTFAGGSRDICKNPIGQKGKRSKSGLVAVVRDYMSPDDRIMYVPADSAGGQNLLEDVLTCGRRTRTHTLADIRARAWSPERVKESA